MATTIIQRAKTSAVSNKTNLDAISADNRTYKTEKIKFFKDGSCDTKEIRLGYKNENNATRLRFDFSELLWNWNHLILHHNNHTTDIAPKMAESFSNYYNFKVFFKSDLDGEVTSFPIEIVNNYGYFSIPRTLTQSNQKMFLVIEERKIDSGDSFDGNIPNDASEILNQVEEDYKWDIVERFVSEPIQAKVQDSIYDCEKIVYDDNNKKDLLNDTHQLEGLVKPKLFGRISDNGQLLICQDENFEHAATSLGRQFDSYVTYILFDPSAITGHIEKLSKYLFFKKKDQDLIYYSPIERMGSEADQISESSYGLNNLNEGDEGYGEALSAYNSAKQTENNEPIHDDIGDYAYVCWIPAGVTAENGEWEICFVGLKGDSTSSQYLFKDESDWKGQLNNLYEQDQRVNGKSYCLISSQQTLNVEKSFGSYKDILRERSGNNESPRLAVSNSFLSKVEEDDTLKYKVNLTLSLTGPYFEFGYYDDEENDEIKQPSVKFDNFEISFGNSDFIPLEGLNEVIVTRNNKDDRATTIELYAIVDESKFNSDIEIRANYSAGIINEDDEFEAQEVHAKTQKGKEGSFKLQDDLVSNNKSLFSPIYYGYITNYDSLQSIVLNENKVIDNEQAEYPHETEIFTEKNIIMWFASLTPLKFQGDFLNDWKDEDFNTNEELLIYRGNTELRAGMGWNTYSEILQSLNLTAGKRYRIINFDDSNGLVVSATSLKAQKIGNTKNINFTNISTEEFNNGLSFIEITHDMNDSSGPYNKINKILNDGYFLYITENKTSSFKYKAFQNKNN